MSNPGTIVPSDTLRQLTELLRLIPSLASVCGPIHRFTMVIDTNAILQDARLAAKASKVDMRPTLEELMDCTVLRCIAPHTVMEEVERNLPGIVECFDESRRARAVELWARYRSKIEWVESADARIASRFPALTARDPSDLPLAAVFRDNNADAIITDDRDLLKSTEVIAIKRTALTAVRDYARAKAPAAAAIAVPVAIGSTALTIVLELWSALSDPWKILVILGGVALLVRAYAASAAEEHATIRAALSDWTTATSSLVATAGEHEAAVVRALRSSGARNFTGQPSTSVA